MTDRELDARVATEVMGWVVAWSDADMPEGWQLSDYQEHPSYSSGTFNFNLPRFSTRIEDAWTVVHNLLAGWTFDLTGWRGGWTARFTNEDFRCYGKGETESLAICRAALDAIETREQARQGL